MKLKSEEKLRDIVRICEEILGLGLEGLDAIILFSSTLWLGEKKTEGAIRIYS